MNKHDHNLFKADAVRRVKIVQGHLKKIEKMLADDAYCPDIIHQSRAVQSALRKIDELILHGHLHSCVLKDLHGSKSETLVSEIVELFKKK